MNKIKRKFPQITISNISKKVYSLDLSGGGTSVSTLRLSFLTSKSDNFQINLNNLITVSIGSFYEFKGYITNKTTRVGMSGEITDLTLVDQSIELDQFYIGLKGKHGGPPPTLSGSTERASTDVNLNTLTPRQSPPVEANVAIFRTKGNTPKNLILVGSAIDPCAGIGDNALDPCDPCSSVVQNYIEQKSDCAKNKVFQLLDVDYSLSELIKAASAHIKFSGSPSSSHRAQHTGTLREVLTTWCQELGYSFYYQNGIVKFFNIQNGITLNSNLDSLFNDCIIEEKTVSESIEQNVNQINIAYFGKNGEIKEYNCTQPGGGSSTGGDGTIVLPASRADAITLQNLIQTNPRLSGPQAYKNGSHFRALITAGHYSQDLRNIICWNKVYGYQKAEEVKIGSHSLMGWDVLAVVHANTTDEQVAKGVYNATSIRGVYEQLIDQYPENQQKSLKARKAYFVIVKESENKAFEFEQSIKQGYCGKYHLLSTDTNDPIVETVGSSYKFVKEVKGHEKFLFKDLLFDHPYVKNIRNNFPSEEGYGIIFDRNPIFYPEASDDEALDDLLKRVDALKIQEVIYANNTLAFADESHKLFLIIPVGDYTISPGRVHQAEINATTRINDGLGLTSNKTFAITFTIDGKSRTVYMPVEASLAVKVSRRNNSSASSSGTGDSRSFGVIPKLEVIVTGGSNQDAKDINCLSTNINYIPITESNLAVGNLKSLKNNNGKVAYCNIDSASILDYGTRIVSQFTDSFNRISKTISYSLFGIPSVLFTPEDGLTNFSIKMDSSGTRTSVSFSNLPPFQKSTEIKRNELNYLLQKNSVKKFINKI